MRLQLLQWIVAQSAARILPPQYPFGYTYIAGDQISGVTELHNDGMIVGYPDNKQADGSFPVVPTANGVEASKQPLPATAAQTNVGTQPAQSPAVGGGTGVTAINFAVKIDDGIPVPDSKRGGGFAPREGGSAIERLLIDKLNIGQSIHIPPTGDPDKPAHRAFSSVVSQANKKLHPRNFVLREASTDDPAGPGARVFRVADMEGERPTRARKAAPAATQAAPAPGFGGEQPFGGGAAFGGPGQGGGFPVPGQFPAPGGFPAAGQAPQGEQTFAPPGQFNPSFGQ